MNVCWKYNSNGNLTISYNGIEKVFTKIGLFDVSQTIENYFNSIGASHLIKRPNRHDSTVTVKENKPKPLNITERKPPPRQLRKNKHKKNGV